MVFGQNLETREILIVTAGIAGGLGICYLGYNFFKAVKKREIETRVSVGKEDLDLPLMLEFEYGDFKATCQGTDPIVCAYLKDLPDTWFTFNQSLLQFTSNCFKKRASAAKRALVVGSGTGLLSFELAKTFTEVKAIEISFTKIITCYRFQNRTPIIYYFPFEGSYRTAEKTLLLEERLVRPVRRRRGVPLENIEFINANPCHELPSQLGRFQGVFLPNSLNDLDDPEGLLREIHRFVEAGGQLFICSDYNWKRISNQHEGFGDVAVTNSFEFLKAVLGEHFSLSDETNIMQVFPESLRSCQVRNCHVTVWSRNGILST